MKQALYEMRGIEGHCFLASFMSSYSMHVSDGEMLHIFRKKLGPQWTMLAGIIFCLWLKSAMIPCQASFLSKSVWLVIIMASIMTDDDIVFIHNLIAEIDRTLLPVVEKIKNGCLGNDERDLLKHIITDEFCIKGLDQNDLPNKYGLYLDDLIDKLGYND